VEKVIRVLLDFGIEYFKGGIEELSVILGKNLIDRLIRVNRLLDLIDYLIN
jgi:hypothetical protein